MHPFARQLLGWQAENAQMRAAALMLEVKGDFCHDIRQILIEAARGKDYIELGMKGRWLLPRPDLPWTGAVENG